MVESMAAGCVQVVTNVSGVSDTVIHDVNGFVHPIGDVAAMADSLETLWEHPELLNKMSARCIEHVRLHHDPEQYDLRFLELIQQAWQQPQRNWSRFRRLIPADVVAEERSRRKGKTMISLKGRIKLKIMAILDKLWPEFLK